MPPHSKTLRAFSSTPNSIFRTHNPRDGVDDLLPSVLLANQLLPAGGSQAVELSALVALCLLPFGGYPTLFFQPMERGVERPGLNLQDLARAPMNGLADSVAVLRPPLQGLENEHVQRPLQ